MGDYSLTGNNCRDFVSRASEILTSDKERRARVREEIDTTEREDVIFVFAVGAAILAAISLGKTLRYIIGCKSFRFRTKIVSASARIFYFFYFISIFILLTRRKATEALIHRIGNYPDLLPEIPRYCCSLVI